MVNPYIVPKFDAGGQKAETRYYWWSWHPKYPYWAKSCWFGATEEEAWEDLAKPFASSMRYYHNKLIREGDGQFTEVADYPCQELEIWQEIARDTRPGWRKPSDAVPREGWEKELE